MKLHERNCNVKKQVPISGECVRQSLPCVRRFVQFSACIFQTLLFHNMSMILDFACLYFSRTHVRRDLLRSISSSDGLELRQVSQIRSLIRRMFCCLFPLAFRVAVTESHLR